MHRKHIAKFLGRKTDAMLAESPFCDWHVIRSLDEEIESLTYDFEHRGVQLRCDHEDRISTIFLRDGNPSAQELAEISFSLRRDQVRAHFGPPESNGAPHVSPSLGEYGAWDRFAREGHFVHVEYWPRVDRIKMITYMRADVAP